MRAGMAIALPVWQTHTIPREIVMLHHPKRAVPALLMLCASTLLAAGAAQAQSWPTRPVTIVVTFPPGGSSDIAAPS